MFTWAILRKEKWSPGSSQVQKQRREMKIMNLRQEHISGDQLHILVSSSPQLDCFAHSHFQALHIISTMNTSQVIKALCLESYSSKTAAWEHVYSI